MFPGALVRCLFLSKAHYARLRSAVLRTGKFAALTGRSSSVVFIHPWGSIPSGDTTDE